MEILVRFDESDRVYRIGGKVSGTVIVTSNTDTSVSDVWLTYRWRTHGEGNRDRGPEERLALGGRNTAVVAGQSAEFPFRFAAPNGPVTYHGQHLNVDWYLTAYARSGPVRVVKTEEDFILLTGPPTAALMLGTQEIALKDLPLRRRQELGAVYGLPEAEPAETIIAAWRSGTRKVLAWVLWAIAASAMFFLCEGLSALMAPHRVLPVVSAIAIVIVLAFGAAYVLRNAYKRKLEVEHLQVEPSTTYPGNTLGCRLDLRVKHTVFLRSISASIIRQERVTRAEGTTTVTEVHIMGKKTYAKRYDESFSEGRAIAFRCSLPVDEDAPASFTAPNNAMEWYAAVQVQLKGWPGLNKTLPIVVLP